MHIWRILTAVTVALVAVTTAPTPGRADDSGSRLAPGGTFIDDDANVHEGFIEAIAASGITKGCNPPRNYEYCPTEPVTRGQMAAFLVRAFDLPVGPANFFEDDDGSVFHHDINALAGAGITKGCDPPHNDRFCPDGPVTREQMATFLVRAMGITEDAESNMFVDDDGSPHHQDIERLASAGITKGCNPPDNDRFCPSEPVQRDQMASFLSRALSLEPIVPPYRPPNELVSSFTTYYSCCEPRVHNIHLIADTVDGYVVLPGETFSVNEYVGPRTESKGYVRAPAIINGESYCCDHPVNVGGGVSQFATTFFNAIFFGAYEDIEHRPHTLYISRYPMGREATIVYPHPDVVFHNDTINPVIIDTSHTATSVTVRFYGHNGGREVDSITSGFATPVDGGTVTVTRIITYPDGSETQESWTWTYQPAA
ncbi:MAG: VanW family protein [Acidimicrobiia bacterium]